MFPIKENIYRGPCQILGLQLQKEGVAVQFEPSARTFHRFPDSLRELATLRLLRGQDLHEITPHLASNLLPRGLKWSGKLGLASAGAVLAARLGFSLNALGKQDMPMVRGKDWVAAVFFIHAISALDALGAAGQSLRAGRAGRRNNSNRVLSYHQKDNHVT